MTPSNHGLFVPACFAINMAFGPNNVRATRRASRYRKRPVA